MSVFIVVSCMRCSMSYHHHDHYDSVESFNKLISRRQLFLISHAVAFPACSKLHASLYDNRYPESYYLPSLSVFYNVIRCYGIFGLLSALDY